MKTAPLWKRCRFSFFNCTFGTYIVAGAAKYAPALIDLVRYTDLNTAFRTDQCTASAGDAVFANMIELLIFHGTTSCCCHNITVLPDLQILHWKKQQFHEWSAVLQIP